ncbi:uncharacterized protein LOC108667440 [Hyalella azteca]|uniref:Uncharacterized protein LOC108667440 n=1 Tax=Hyalella azteca TaxID=294128 RepID=A0A8B7N9J4_HYAAZ|nr:uncharacterized protein LOC108667440 [Hyalella azteca]
MKRTSMSDFLALLLVLTVSFCQWKEVYTDEECFPFGREVDIDDILKQMKTIGRRSKLTSKESITDKSCSGNNRNDCVKSMETISSNSNEQMVEMKIGSDEPFKRIPSSNSDIGTGTLYLNDAKDEATDNVLDYSLDSEKSNLISNYDWDSSEIFVHLNSTNDRQKRSMDDGVSDILQPLNGERQARLFFNYESAASFNLSLQLRIPLIAFKLPGANDVTQDLEDGNAFGKYSLFNLYLLGALAVAIHTTAQGSLDSEEPSPEAPLRRLDPAPPSQGNTSALPSTVHAALEDVVDVLKEENAKRKLKVSQSSDATSFNFDDEFYIEDVLMHIEAMSSKHSYEPALADEFCSEENSTNCRKKLANTSQHSLQHEDQNFYSEAYDNIQTSITSLEALTVINSTNQTTEMSLNSSMDEEKSNQTSNSYWDLTNIFYHLNSEDERMERPLEDRMSSETQLLTAGERQGRQFILYNRAAAFNWTVAFTVPLIAFTLPGAGDTRHDWEDNSVFGTLVFSQLFMVASLVIALYTTTVGEIGEEAPLQPLGRAFRTLGDSRALSEAVHGALEELADALEVKSCTHLATCEAYTDLHANSLLSLPFRAYTP